MKPFEFEKVDAAEFPTVRTVNQFGEYITASLRDGSVVFFHSDVENDKCPLRIFSFWGTAFGVSKVVTGDPVIVAEDELWWMLSAKRLLNNPTATNF